MNRVEHGQQDAVSLFLRIWHRWLKKYLPLILLNFSLILVFSAINGLYAPLIKYIVDGATAGRSNTYWILLAALVVTFIKAASLLAHKRVNVRLFARVGLDIQRSLHKKMIGADLAWHGLEPPAALAQRVMSDVSAVSSGLERVVNNLIRDIFMLIAITASMIYIDWQLSLIALCIFPLAIWPISIIGRKLRSLGRQAQSQIGQVSAGLIEGLSSIQIAKTYQLEERLHARAGDDLNRLRRLQVRAGDQQALVEPMMEILGGLAVIGVLFFVGWRLEAGINTLGDFAGFITALLLAGRPIKALGSLTAHIQRGLAASERVFQVLDEPPKVVDATDAQPLTITEASIAFTNAGFSYADGTRALDKVTLKMPGGSRLALVGRSGAGKSTLFNLVPRLFDPTVGSISIDSQDLRSVTLQSLRANIALVTQDAILFNDTVRANIALGHKGDAESVSDEVIIEAAKSAAAHDFIMELSDGYNTVIGVGGDRLSGGQRQRLSIARAFLRDAPILLLDEATSALDAEAEALIKKALDRLTEGRTTITIAHHLSTIMDADLIAVLDGGYLIETGTHAELLASEGVYASLFRLQFKGIEVATGALT